MTSEDLPEPPVQGQPLTRLQESILQVIRESTANRRFPPSLREIAQAVGLASASSVSYHLSALEKMGYLTRNVGQPRTAVEMPGNGVSQPEAAQAPLRPGSSWLPLTSMTRSRCRWFGRDIPAGHRRPVLADAAQPGYAPIPVGGARIMGKVVAVLRIV